MAHLAQIAAFIAVVEQNSFIGAARQLEISTAAISRQVSRLEAELQVQLLHRTTRQVTVTEIGAEYYQQCKKTLAELTEAERAITASNTEATGTLSISSSRYFALQYLLPRLPEFMQQNPQLKIKIELAERFPDLEKEDIDLIFGISLSGQSNLVRKRVAITRYVLCASPAYLKKYKTPKKPEDLHQHFYITHSIRRPNNIITFKDKKQVIVKPILEINDSQALRDCAIRDMGIVMLHDYMVSTAIQKGQLIELLKNFQEPQQSVYLYYQQSRYLQPKIRRFIDFFTTS